MGGVPKGRLFPLTRDELVECAALLDAVRAASSTVCEVPAKPLDVLAQQIVAEVSAREWQRGCAVRAGAPRVALPRLARAEFDECVRMLAEGFSTRRGRQGALHSSRRRQRVLRARRGARLTAITSGGAIPDNADYRVMLEPEAQLIGTVNEDFAVESLQGDVFQLGNTSYRILRVERGTVRVEDAHGQPPTMPFWLGEAPGRSAELSEAVSRLRQGDRASASSDGIRARRVRLADRRRSVSTRDAALADRRSISRAGRAALGALPTPNRSCSSASSTSPAACSSSSTPRSAAA